MKSLVVGYGEIGRAVGENIGEHSFIDIDTVPSPGKIDIMHVCFPYTDNFLTIMEEYITKYSPNHVIIYSTVPIGTTKSLSIPAVHSPIEGKHPDLSLSFRTMRRWIGSESLEERTFFQRYFKELLLDSKVVESSDFTEFLKLRSTAKYGINLVWTDYEKRVADEIDMPFELLNELDRDYNKLYGNLGIDWARRYILTPPNGKIGGHCVVPNAFILDDQFPNDMLKMIKDMQ